MGFRGQEAEPFVDFPTEQARLREVGIDAKVGRENGAGARLMALGGMAKLAELRQA